MKKKLSSISKIAIFTLVVITVITTTGCKKDNTQSMGLPGYSNIKTSDWRTKIGTEYTVEGYYDEENGVGRILNNPEAASIDAPTSEDNYLWIAKTLTSNPAPFLQQFVGRKVTIIGHLFPETEPSLVSSSRMFGDPSLAGLIVTQIIPIDSVSYFRPSTVVDFCKRYPGICNLQITPIQSKVALLYSGGINAGNAHHRYWNDIYVMYGILKSKGFTDANIVVVYKDGVADDHAADVPVDYAASPEGFNSAISLLQDKMGPSTKFFCFINNHGGGYETSTGNNYGITDVSGDDTRPGVTDHNTDEQIYFYNSGTAFPDDLLATKINSLTFGSGIFLLKPCFSGGLIWDLRGPNRVIMSSGTEFQVTYPTISGNYGELAYNFMSAITGLTPDGVTVNADLNSDGKVSMYEAYMYVKTNEHRSEQPQFDDDGDGYSTTTPSSVGFGAGVFL